MIRRIKENLKGSFIYFLVSAVALYAFWTRSDQVASLKKTQEQVAEFSLESGEQVCDAFVDSAQALHEVVHLAIAVSDLPEELLELSHAQVHDILTGHLPDYCDADRIEL